MPNDTDLIDQSRGSDYRAALAVKMATPQSTIAVKTPERVVVTTKVDGKVTLIFSPRKPVSQPQTTS